MGLPPRPSPIGIAASKPVRRRRPVTRPVPVPVVIVVPPPLPPLRTCQFPFGHPKERGFRFCEAALQGGGVYCREHLALCYGSRRDLAA
jgi:GcrA cell cycle regulator